MGRAAGFRQGSRDVATLAKIYLNTAPSRSASADADASDLWSTLVPTVVIGGAGALGRGVLPELRPLLSGAKEIELSFAQIARNVKP